MISIKVMDENGTTPSNISKILENTYFGGDAIAT